MSPKHLVVWLYEISDSWRDLTIIIEMLSQLPITRGQISYIYLRVVLLSSKIYLMSSALFELKPNQRWHRAGGEIEYKRWKLFECLMLIEAFKGTQGTGLTIILRGTFDIFYNNKIIT